MTTSAFPRPSTRTSTWPLPSVQPGPRQLAMVHQVVQLYDRFVAPNAPVTGEAAGLLTLLGALDLDEYVTLIERLRARGPGRPGTVRLAMARPAPPRHPAPLTPAMRTHPSGAIAPPGTSVLAARCGRCEAQPMRSASETMIPSGPRT